MTRILWVLLGLPIGVALVALGVANRAPITISLDPFAPGSSVLAIHPPLFIAFFVVLAVGVFVGGVAMWFSQHKYRRALHRARDEASRLRMERDQIAAELASASGSNVPALSYTRRAA